MKTKLTVEKEQFKPITIEVVLESFDDVKDFYKGIGYVPYHDELNFIYKELKNIYPNLSDF